MLPLIFNATSWSPISAIFTLKARLLDPFLFLFFLVNFSVNFLYICSLSLWYKFDFLYQESFTIDGILNCTSSNVWYMPKLFSIKIDSLKSLYTFIKRLNFLWSFLGTTISKKWLFQSESEVFKTIVFGFFSKG